MNRRTFLQSAVAGGSLIIADPAELGAQRAPNTLEGVFRNPPADAGLSVVYHWTGGVVSKEGITADMDGIAASGINTVNWFYFDGNNPEAGTQAPACKTPEWWDLVNHLMSEARRNNLTIAPHVCSSWGPAGSDAITPELSQQHLAWSEVEIEGGRPFGGVLPKPQRQEAAGRRGAGGAAGGAAQAGRGGAGRGAADAQAGAAAAVAFGGGGGRAMTFPDAFRNYYRDLAVLAFPIPADYGETSVTRKAKVTSDLPITDLAKAADPANTERVVDTEKAGYVQFAFDQPFTLRSVTVHPGPTPGAGFGGGFGAGAPGQAPATNPYRIAHGLEVQASDDGVQFRKIGQLEPMYNGWQTTVSALTHTVKETRARFFRLVHHPRPPLGYDEGMRSGTRGGGGDFAHMIEPLGFAHIVLSSTATVHHLPGKSSATWGKSRLVTDEELPASACVPLAGIVDLTSKMKEDGSIAGWTPGPGKWKVQRIGYLSGLEATGGGLQCDKMNREAARIVFQSWFDEIRKRTPDSSKFVNVLNIDSWECRSQNWSPVLRDEFRKRRGYDPIRYLPAMTGVMVESAGATEGFLLDLRRTISECIADNHFGTMYQLAHENNCIVMIEDVNPAVTVDGMEPYKNTDWTGGEFWVRNSTNWKANDMGDGVAGARIYGKKIMFAEAFTGGAWQDHPFALKAMGDHNYTEGLNRMMLHVWNEQHHPTRAPGIPGAGTPFNYLNTWWKAGQAWRDYMKRAQALLQEGQPAADMLYFAGENIPCRSLLKPTLGSCWFADPAPPAGYSHDTLNRDGLLRLAKVQNGRIVVSGLSYRMLVLKADEPYLTPAVAAKLRDLVKAGAVVYGPKPKFSPSNEQGAAGQALVRQVADELWGKIDGRSVTENRVGQGRVFYGKPIAEVLRAIEAQPDVLFTNLVGPDGAPVVVNASVPMGALGVAAGAERKGWGMEFCHRRSPAWDMYFLSNQEFFPVSTDVSFRITGKVPEFWYADSGRIEEAPLWREEAGRTVIPMKFDPSGSVFVIFRRAAAGADPVVQVTGKATGLRLARTAQAAEAWATDAGDWTLKTRSGKSMRVRTASVPAAIAVSGNWNVRFPVRTGPLQLELTEGSWTKHSREDIRFFSGTAVYSKSVEVPAAWKTGGQRIYLDLGDVQNLARVRVNGKDLGVLWKAPYRVDITEAAVGGQNRLELEVTNTWVNRLLGDASKPEAERTTYVAAGRGGGRGGPQITEPIPAGLIGPVRVIAEVKLQAAPLGG